MLPKMIRRSAVLFLALASLPLCAQAAAPSVTLPLPGVHYRYWPEQLVQWVGPELPYSMIVLNVDNRGKQPIYDVELIDKSGKNVVHYTNTPEELAIDRAAGFPAYQVPMRFDEPPAPANGAQYLLRFVTEKGMPVVWQFVLGTDVTDQGSGLSAVPAPFPVLMYRTQGGLAGQGTALKVGDVTSAAAEWSQIAQPPYFIPYRGALSTGVQILAFVPGSTSWKSSGSTLIGAGGAPLGVDKVADGVMMTDSPLGTTAEYETSGAGISSVTFGPEKAKRGDTVSLEFSPALAPGLQSRVDVVIGKKHVIAAGTVQNAHAEAGRETLTWSFHSPDDLRGKQAEASGDLQH